MRIYWRSGVLYRIAPKFSIGRDMWILGRIGVIW